MNAILLTALVVLGAPSGVPVWADSVFRHSPAYSSYDYVSQMNPGIVVADFDGDGVDDVAIEIRSRDGLTRGLALIHHGDGSVHVLGAGHDVGDGNDEIRQWSVIKLRHHRVGIRVTRGLEPGGDLEWDGQAYSWLPAQ